MRIVGFSIEEDIKISGVNDCSLTDVDEFVFNETTVLHHDRDGNVHGAKCRNKKAPVKVHFYSVGKASDKIGFRHHLVVIFQVGFTPPPKY